MNLVKPLVNNSNSNVFISSTVNGYEGTGRSLSLKLIKEIKENSENNIGNTILRELEMTIPIRYNI